MLFPRRPSSMFAAAGALLLVGSLPMVATGVLFDKNENHCAAEASSPDCPTSEAPDTSGVQHTGGTDPSAALSGKLEAAGSGRDIPAAIPDASAKAAALIEADNRNALERSTASNTTPPLNTTPSTNVVMPVTATTTPNGTATPPPNATTAPTSPSTLAPEVSTPPTAIPAPSCFISQAINAGDSGPNIACLQLRLRELGFYTGEVRGTHDRDSQNSVRAYQQTIRGLKVDGKPGRVTLTHLGLWREPVAPPAPTPAPNPAPNPGLYPNWSVTADGVPFYAGRRACSNDRAAVIMAEFARNGAGLATQQWAVYVASREAGCDHTTVNNNASTRDDSHCAFQLNALAGLFKSDGVLGKRGWTPSGVRASLQACADAASDFWVMCGRGPWTKPYNCRPSTVDGDRPVSQVGNATTPGGAPADTTTTTTSSGPAPETTTAPEPALTTTPPPAPPGDAATTTTTTAS